jgi:hypothetical protein
VQPITTKSRGDGLRNKFLGAAFALALLGSQIGTVQADTRADDGVFDSIAVYAGQGVDHNLLEMPRAFFKGIDWEKSSFSGVGLSKTGRPLGEVFGSLQETSFGSVRQGYEVVYLQHHGLQGNSELGAAYTLRTPDLELGPLGVNFGAGAGLSYAFGTPLYEDGPKNDPGRRYPFQFLALYELEWRVRGLEDFSLVTRVHHRSGVYGLIAPRNVGSNFLAAGVRYKF